MLTISPGEAKSIVKTRDELRKSGARDTEGEAVGEKHSREKAMCPRAPSVSTVALSLGAGHLLRGGLYGLI